MINKDSYQTLDIINLSCTRQQRIIFSSINYQLSPGRLLLVEGVNGSGKSTLLRMLAGYITPTQGEIRWQAKSIDVNRTDYSHSLHYMGHTNGIKLGLTVSENIQLSQHLLLSSSSSQQSQILDELNLSSYFDIPAYRLSAGQKRRIALAKLFLFPKRLWILDEPLTSLDQSMQNIFLSKLKNHVKNGGIGVISSHQTIHLTGTPMDTLQLGKSDT